VTRCSGIAAGGEGNAQLAAHAVISDKVTDGQVVAIAPGRVSLTGDSRVLQHLPRSLWQGDPGCLALMVNLTYHDSSRRAVMASVKVSSKVDEKVWDQLKEMAAESHQSVSGLLTEAIREFVARRRVRPDVLVHLERSLSENEDLGRLLAK
jgi:predicted transcriptional regulator